MIRKIVKFPSILFSYLFPRTQGLLSLRYLNGNNRRFILKLSLALGMFIFIFSNAHAQAVLNIQHWNTRNGAQVYFVQTEQLPILDIRLVFAAGSSQDQAAYGLASLTNSLIGEGSEHLSANQIADNFDSVGAAFSVQAGRDQASISLRTLTQKEFFEPALKTFIEVASLPIFSQDSIQRAKNAAYSAIQSQLQDPGSLASKIFYENVFKNTSYGHSAIGTQKTVAAITRPEMMNFYHQYYVAKNMKIILVGDISKEKATEISNTISEKFPVGKTAETQAMVQATLKSDTIKVPFPAGQTSLMLGQVGISRKDPDFFPLMVGNMVLGGSSQTSLFYDVLRNQNGLVYYAESEFMPMRSRGPFLISLKTKNQQADLALNLVHKIVGKYIQEGPSDSQLSESKQNIIGRFPLQISSNSNILDAVSSIAFYDLPLDFLDSYRDKVNSVTSNQVKEAFKKHVNPNNFVTVLVGGDSAKK